MMMVMMMNVMVRQHKDTLRLIFLCWVYSGHNLTQMGKYWSKIAPH